MAKTAAPASRANRYDPAEPENIERMETPLQKIPSIADRHPRVHSFQDRLTILLGERAGCDKRQTHVNRWETGLCCNIVTPVATPMATPMATVRQWRGSGAGAARERLECNDAS
jgi:hypothetical protein